ncbi:MAG: TetR/AcrR family transcriptional regulator [Silicimonas sp.]|nr:TetR/AcrR family transcriptional regulator [Silicimonas sp.]
MARKTGSHADITGPAIKASALRLFARSGYAAVSMREIAGDVGVRAGALYLYTPDKQTLLFDLLREHMEHLLASWTAAKSGATPLERLETFVHFHVDYHFDRSDEVFLSYMELRNLSPDNFGRIEVMRRRYEAELEAILCDGDASGAFHLPDLRVTTRAMIAMLNGVLTWYREDGHLSRDSIRKMHWQMARGMVQA